MRIEKKGKNIRSIDDWKEFASPKAEYQWQEGRSACELARAWCGHGEPAMPATMRTMLDSRPETEGLVVDCVFPEHQIRFDTYGGEPRNADLAFIGQTGTRKVAVTVEAKADEPYGSTIARTACAAIERRVTNPRSRGTERITDLVAWILQPWTGGLPHIDGLYYQLMTAAAGSLAYAVEHAAPLAVLIVHEFVTEKTEETKHAHNTKAYLDFLHRLSGTPVSETDADALLGPFSVPRCPLSDQPLSLLIGKVTTDLRRN